MVINSILQVFRTEPSSRGLSFFSFTVLLFHVCGVTYAQPSYKIFDNEEAHLIFFTPQHLNCSEKKVDILADFTVILKKTGGPDSARMNFTIASHEAVMNWHFVSLNLKDTSFKLLEVVKIYQEKNHQNWDNRFSVMISLHEFQRFIESPSKAIIFSFDDELLNASFDKKTLKVMADFATQIRLDMKTN